jgi:hypothetical protein
MINLDLDVLLEVQVKFIACLNLFRPSYQSNMQSRARGKKRIIKIVSNHKVIHVSTHETFDPRDLT